MPNADKVSASLYSPGALDGHNTAGDSDPLQVRGESSITEAGQMLN